MAAAEPNQLHFPTRSIDIFIPIEEGTSKHVHLQILQGDITTEDTQAVVVFRASDDTVEGDSLRVLQVAGQGIDDEYQRVKAQRGREVTKGVVRTQAGNLDKPRHILHLQVGNNCAKFCDTLATALQVADRLELKSIAFPSLHDRYSSPEVIKTLLLSFEEFTRKDHPICLHFIQVVIFKHNGFAQYAEAR